MKRKLNGTALLLAVSLLVFSVSAAAVTFAANAGTDQDPLVTLSYVEKRIQEVLSSVNTQIADLKKQLAAQPASGGTSGSAVFQVVQAEKGSFIYFGGSTEFIVRSGKVAVIATVNGGLSDLTDGKDIGMGQSVPANHHMLVPRDDGRGLSVLDTTFVLIKGPYTVTQ